MEHIINISNLNILNTGQPTHVSESAIDLTVTSAEIASDGIWEVYPSVLSGDHHSIIVTIETPVIYQPTQRVATVTKRQIGDHTKQMKYGIAYQTTIC